MNRQEIIERLSADEDRCKYCNSSTVSGGDIYCSAGYSHDMNCGGKEFKLDYKIEEVISALEQQLTNRWIPVTESLPEENIDGITDDFLPYNVSLKFKYGECVRTYQFGQGRWWNHGDDMTRYVIAWQPLPPKYKEVSE